MRYSSIEILMGAVVLVTAIFFLILGMQSIDNNQKDGYNISLIFGSSSGLKNGDDVKISSFGTFVVRQKKERIGRNPKTGQEVPITARSVVTFRASNVLKSKVNSKNKMNSEAAIKWVQSHPKLLEL